VKLRGKKVLVAGGAGFIGSHLVDALLSRDCMVRVVDNLSRGQLRNLEHCLDRIEFLKGDLSLGASAVEGVDVVFDLAAAVFGGRRCCRPWR
jgi:nucleoside-diphosphate-sugar epimerase